MLSISTHSRKYRLSFNSPLPQNISTKLNVSDLTSFAATNLLFLGVIGHIGGPPSLVLAILAPAKYLMKETIDYSSEFSSFTIVWVWQTVFSDFICNFSKKVVITQSSSPKSPSFFLIPHWNIFFMVNVFSNRAMNFSASAFMSSLQCQTLNLWAIFQCYCFKY